MTISRANTYLAIFRTPCSDDSARLAVPQYLQSRRFSQSHIRLASSFSELHDKLAMMKASPLRRLSGFLAEPKGGFLIFPIDMVSSDRKCINAVETCVQAEFRQSLNTTRLQKLSHDTVRLFQTSFDEKNTLSLPCESRCDSTTGYASSNDQNVMHICGKPTDAAELSWYDRKRIAETKVTNNARW